MHENTEAGVPYKTATLVFPSDVSRILLGLKKTGLGKGFFNGFGGKVEKGESVRQGAFRELSEETGIALGDLREELLTYVGKIRFKWPEVPKNNMVVHVFFYHCLHAFEAQDTEEMTPTWFKKDSVPYSNMWEDDAVWLRALLNTKCQQIIGNFEYDENGRLFEFEVHAGRKLLKPID
jgi:8-oxo-dGTP pyrophosphatase MutT (NUDIX family)